MKIDFRQGVVSHQVGGFLSIAGGNVSLLASNRPVTVTIAHKYTDYIHSEDNEVANAWPGPFSPSASYWLYWDFNKLTFERSFGVTTLEPVAQSAEPGHGDEPIIEAVPGDNGLGQFVVQAQYILPVDKEFIVLDSTGNNGLYTVASSAFDSGTGRTTIAVNEEVTSSVGDGQATLDIDSAGNPLLAVGRMWYDTINDTHKEWAGSYWVEVLRVFAAQVINGNTFISMSIGSTGGSFIGTQVGDTASRLAGRVLFGEEAGNPIRRDDGTWYTTEDQFFTNQSRVDALRLESNVVRAQSTSPSIAAFQPVAWISDGHVQSAVYEDTGNTVIGMMTEDVLASDVGAIIIQGGVTNPAWTWLDDVPVGTELYIDEGALVAYDPHVADPITHPVGMVPVGRVLSTDTIIFEQGLGGKGDRGPTGAVDNLPPATVVEIGAVTLLTPSSDPLRALVVSDTDVRLADSRTPLPHLHAGVDVAITPTGDVSSNNVQSAIAELAAEKLAVAGGTMTGPITLSGGPSASLHATSKQYVDSLVNGLIWLEPISLINLIDDTETVPPVSPNNSDAYIIPAGASGAWSAITVGHVVVFDGVVWLDRGPVSTFDKQRLGVAFDTSTVPAGSFAGQKNKIAVFSGDVFDTFITPTSNNAVYVTGDSSLHAYDQFAFSGTAWVLFGGTNPIIPDDTTFKVVGGVASVIPWTGEGGTVDAELLQGMAPGAFAAAAHTHTGVYAPAVHGHADEEIVTGGFVASIDWGTQSDASTLEITGSEVQTNFEEVMEQKASKLPSYADSGDFPTAANVEGMFVYAEDTQDPYYSNGTIWNKLSIDGHTHPTTIPYDISFFIAGPLIPDIMVGSFLATRVIHLEAGVVDSIANAGTVIPVSQPSNIFDVRKNGVSVGTITFVALSSSGVITIASDVDLVAGDLLQVYAPAVVDATLKDLTVSLVACADATSCSL